MQNTVAQIKCWLASEKHMRRRWQLSKDSCANVGPSLKPLWVKRQNTSPSPALTMRSPLPILFSPLLFTGNRFRSMSFNTLIQKLNEHALTIQYQNCKGYFFLYLYSSSKMIFKRTSGMFDINWEHSGMASL